MTTKQKRSLGPAPLLYPMNKLHWNSISLEKDFADEFLEELIDESYKIILESLSKKAQAAILVDKPT